MPTKIKPFFIRNGFIFLQISFSFNVIFVFTGLPPAWKLALILLVFGTLKTPPAIFPLIKIILLSPSLKFFKNLWTMIGLLKNFLR